MDKGIATNRFGPMIVVMPDQRTKMMGSFYRNSAVTGNWEDFTVEELVAHIDKNYRTLARAASRGIAGHSMGGHGAIVLAMKHPDVFGVVYGMSPAVLGWGGDLSIKNSAFATILAARGPEELFKKRDTYAVGLASVAQAFSPNRDRPPFYADFPYAVAQANLQPSEPAFSKWRESFPLNMVHEHRAGLTRLRGIRFDCGTEDQFTHIPVTSRELSFVLTNHGIDHVFEEYNGDHRNRLWGRTGRLYT